jgi:hypothetical protein
MSMLERLLLISVVTTEPPLESPQQVERFRQPCNFCVCNPILTNSMDRNLFGKHLVGMSIEVISHE